MKGPVNSFLWQVDLGPAFYSHRQPLAIPWGKFDGEPSGTSGPKYLAMLCDIFLCANLMEDFSESELDTPITELYGFSEVQILNELYTLLRIRARNLSTPRHYFQANQLVKTADHLVVSFGQSFPNLRLIQETWKYYMQKLTSGRDRKLMPEALKLVQQHRRYGVDLSGAYSKAELSRRFSQFLQLYIDDQDLQLEDEPGLFRLNSELRNVHPRQWETIRKNLLRNQERFDNAGCKPEDEDSFQATMQLLARIEEDEDEDEDVFPLYVYEFFTPFRIEKESLFGI